MKNVNTSIFNNGAVDSAPTQENPVYGQYMSAQAVNNMSSTVENMTAEPERVKPYSFRNLNSTDLFPMIKIISKIGLDELTTVFDGDALKAVVEKFRAKKEGEDASKDVSLLVGLNISLKLVNKIIEHIPACESDIYTLLAGISEMSVDAVKALDIDIFMEMLLDLVTKEEFKRFFKVASKYIKK